jgi:hypothetical protein
MSFYNYDATAFRADGERKSVEFERLSDAIVWLRRMLEAGDGYTVYGEIRSRDQLLWRGGKRPVGKSTVKAAPVEPGV